MSVSCDFVIPFNFKSENMYLNRYFWFIFSFHELVIYCRLLSSLSSNCTLKTVSQLSVYVAILECTTFSHFDSMDTLHTNLVRTSMEYGTQLLAFLRLWIVLHCGYGVVLLGWRPLFDR